MQPIDIPQKEIEEGIDTISPYSYQGRSGVTGEVSITFTGPELEIVQEAMARLSATWKDGTHGLPAPLTFGSARLLTLVNSRIDRGLEMLEPKPSPLEVVEDPDEALPPEGVEEPETEVTIP